MENIGENWLILRDEIAAAAIRSGRDPAAVEVVAVTKTRSIAEIEAAIRCGLTLLGENRVQEAAAKKDLVAGAASWQLIGRLQSNKAAKAVALFDGVQSLDGWSLAQALDRRAAQAGRTVDVMVQVNTAGAAQQGGVEPARTDELVARVAGLAHLRLCGLMTIAAHSRDEGEVRSCFARLRAIRERLDPTGGTLRHLSMGMSGDFVWAVEEGATMLRLGTALFGARPG